MNPCVSRLMTGTGLALSLAFSHVAWAGEAIRGTAMAAIRAQPELSTFAQLIRQAGLEAPLVGSGPVTVFAPSNAAFQNVPMAIKDRWAKDPEQLKATLAYHIVPGLVESSHLTDNAVMTTLSGATLHAAKAGGFVTVGEGVVVEPDTPVGNGVVHVIDTVLTPSAK